MNISVISYCALVFLSLSLLIAIVFYDFRKKYTVTLLIFSVMSLVLFMFADRLNLISFMLLLAIALAAFGINKVKLQWAKGILTTLFLLSTVAAALHLLPGVSNFLLLENIQISAQAKSIDIWANVDKGLAGLFLLMFMVAQYEYREEIYSQKSALIKKKSTWIFWSLIPLYVVSMMAIGLVFGLDADLKLPSSTLIFFASNLLFSVIAEEAFFRGVVQETLARRLSGKVKHSQYAAIFIASVIFGAAHLGGGVQFAILSTIAGLFYGYAYLSTGKISAAILTHSAVNMCHFLLLEYPAT